MATNTAGDSARQFPWQMSHYIVRGGPNDPTVPSASGAGGILSFNGTITVPPVPGVQPALGRTETLIATTASGTSSLTTNNGGVLLGVIPAGSWIVDLQLYCFAALSGGTATTIGFYAVNANSSYPQASVTPLAYITSPGATTLYALRSAGGATAFSAVNATLLGPKAALTADQEIYAVNWLTTGSGTVNTAGDFAAFIEFTGLEG